jgi:hypothetical protein
MENSMEDKGTKTSPSKLPLNKSNSSTINGRR